MSKIENKIITIDLNGVPCNICLFGEEFIGDTTPLFIIPVAGDVSELIEGQYMQLAPAIESGEFSSHVLVTFETKNWNDDLSPWPAPALLRKQEEFRGLAAETLQWIQYELIPKVTSYVPSVKSGKKGLLGYSMAGMFALWAIYKTDVFTVVASCSGSLWYDGFCDYVEQKSPLSTCSVYVSLGDREELSRNPWFAQVGEATRRITTLLKESAMCQEVKLVWNSGGHFEAAAERLAAAQLWMKKVCEQ